ncbi:hypothetical protein [Nesterenkonia alba]|uniref:hypothetical protein n=1 Tax=Nesterenkonia alba TaxID=515814 RepID=UPI0003B3F0E9|nr:hypothetical protein [Nesterenkonia alba]
MRTTGHESLPKVGMTLLAVAALGVSACGSDEKNTGESDQVTENQNQANASDADNPGDEDTEDDDVQDESASETTGGAACDLLTEEEIEEVFGSTVQEGVGSQEASEEVPGGQDGASCLWQGEEAMVSLTVFREGDAASAEEAFEMTARPLQDQDLEEVDIADEALWIGEGMLLFREDETVYMLSLGAVELEQAQHLAELVLGND